VFDREGNCFRTVNNLDEVERTKEAAVDSDSIRAPMPGVVTRVLFKEGDSVKKVSCFFPSEFPGTNCCCYGGDEDGASNQGSIRHRN
jgi:hypothetical protein